MKFDQDLCLNLCYDLKKLLWQDELNPRVRCAFGNVLTFFANSLGLFYGSFSLALLTLCLLTMSITKTSLKIVDPFL